MTDRVLEGLCYQAANMAKVDLRMKRWRSILLATYHEGETLYRMRKFEREIEERLGEDWLEHGGSKDLGFGMLQYACTLSPPDAIVIVSVVNKFRPTKALETLPPEEIEYHLNRHPDGHKHHHEMLKQGLLTMCDALACIAQTPERVCMYSQDIMGRGVFTGKPDVHFSDASHFDGRLKMYRRDGKTDVDDFIRRRTQ